MYLTILNVIYVLLALTMAGFILLQRGAGAQAGSGFGSGASGTVFGARGSANFLTKATGWLAAAFFAMSLAMGMYISHAGLAKKGDDLGVMGRETPAATTPAAPAAGTATTDVPTAPAVPAGAAPAAPTGTAPAAPTGTAPAPAAAPTGTAPAGAAPSTPATPAAPAASTPEPAKH
jgi:preprotein translocase subunit SecG